jgi:hypothetical protein
MYRAELLGQLGPRTIQPARQSLDPVSGSNILANPHHGQWGFHIRGRLTTILNRFISTYLMRTARKPPDRTPVAGAVTSWGPSPFFNGKRTKRHRQVSFLNCYDAPLDFLPIRKYGRLIVVIGDHVDYSIRVSVIEWFDELIHRGSLRMSPGIPLATSIDIDK